MSEQSRWLRNRGSYRTPDGTTVQLMNGRLLWMYRNSEQRRAADAARKAQERRHEEIDDARPA